MDLGYDGVRYMAEFGRRVVGVGGQIGKAVSARSLSWIVFEPEQAVITGTSLTSEEADARQVSRGFRPLS